MGLLVYRAALYTVPGLRTLITMTFWAGQKNSQMLKPFIICKQSFLQPTRVLCFVKPFHGKMEVSNALNHETENKTVSKQHKNTLRCAAVRFSVRFR